MSECFAFIFARGGSKGIPGKNIKPLAGRPLISYSIEVAKAVSEIRRVFVSTDDRKTARIALDCGAEIIDRPPELASDTAPEWLAWKHAVIQASERYGSFDTFISLPATSPLRDETDVKNALAMFSRGRFDTVLTVTESKRSPWFNMVKRHEDGEVEILVKGGGAIVRRQDAPSAYDITTVAYVSRPEFILNANGIFEGRVGGVVVPEERALDLDSQFDFDVADILMRKRKGMGH